MSKQFAQLLPQGNHMISIHGKKSPNPRVIPQLQKHKTDCGRARVDAAVDDPDQAHVLESKANNLQRRVVLGGYHRLVRIFPAPLDLTYCRLRSPEFILDVHGDRERNLGCLSQNLRLEVKMESFFRRPTELLFFENFLPNFSK